MERAVQTCQMGERPDAAHGNQGPRPGARLPRVLALVVDFRTTDEARKLTVQLATRQAGDHDLVVVHVDNGNAATVDLAPEQERCRVRLLRIARNGGYAAGLDAALRSLDEQGESFDAYWFLNSDLELGGGCLAELVGVLRDQPRVGAVGPVVFHGHTGKVWGARGLVSPWFGTTAMRPWPGGELPRWSYIPGCSMLVRATAYRDVGGLPSQYGMYYEETDLCVRLQQRGWKLWVAPSAEAYHGIASREAGVPAPHFAYFFTRNNLYFWQTNFGIPWPVQLPRTLFVVVRDLLVPLRRARSARELLNRLAYVGMGLIDSVPFVRGRGTYFEKKHFDLTPPPGGGRE